jgi:hypothetical protein
MANIKAQRIVGCESAMKKRRVEYEPMLVSYVDILGFGELIKTKSAGEISRILRVFNQTTAPHRFKGNIDIPDLPKQEQVSFSDLTMTCTPLRKQRNRGVVFNQFLRHVHAQSILLIEEGLLIRGGIAVGQATKKLQEILRASSHSGL